MAATQHNAPNLSGATRRAALAAGAALLAAPATAAPNPDAELIRLADEVIRLQAALCATYEGLVTLEQERAVAPEQTRLAELIDDAADDLAEMAPSTLAGFIAKARAAFALGTQTRDGELEATGIDDLLLVALVEDLARLGGPLPIMRS